MRSTNDHVTTSCTHTHTFTSSEHKVSCIMCADWPTHCTVSSTGLTCFNISTHRVCVFCTTFLKIRDGRPFPAMKWLIRCYWHWQYVFSATTLVTSDTGGVSRCKLGHHWQVPMCPTLQNSTFCCYLLWQNCTAPCKAHSLHICSLFLSYFSLILSIAYFNHTSSPLLMFIQQLITITVPL